MRHTAARTAFATGVLLAAVVLALAARAAITPKPVPQGEPRLAIATLATLREREPHFVIASGLNSLKVEARRVRSARWPYPHPPMPAAVGSEGDLGVYVVRYDGTVRAFIAADPRNGCRLALETLATRLGDGELAFHDVCHGSLYDVNGVRIGGPSPWALDELVVSVRNGTVFVERQRVIPGRFLHQ